MANYVIADPIAGVPAQPVSLTASVQQFPLGLQVKAYDQVLGAGVFQYCVGNAAASAVSSAGQFVAIVGNTAQLVSTAHNIMAPPIGLAAGPLSNTNCYGWVQVQGMADYAKCNSNNITAGSAFYFCATNGLLAQGKVAACQVYGVAAPVSGNSTLGTGAVGAITLQLNYPFPAGSTAANV